jgi:hypothetical protein
MMMLRAGMIAVMLSVLSTAALAQTAAERAACSADVKTFCAGLMPGGGRLLNCLADHKDKISPTCAKVVASHGR